ncbi:MAG TPA: TIGR03619 family F420-dependent LLM class oxidoreductase [bacterium]|nr:TIGR03619 family F420-dependent LLM class oxidoreductase [bacterium]
MEYGITLPGAGPLATPEALTAVATLAESLGYASVWVTDHIAFPEQHTSAYPYRADRKAPWPSTISYLDAFTALSWVGAVTRRVGLGTSVLILPLRPPLIVAKTVATLDYLSGGRMLLGVGAGWLREEFDLLGQPFEDRGRRMREAIRILRACWGPDPVRFEGAFYHLAPFGMDPKPVQGPRLPVLGGGEGDVALRRVAEVCDGWHPLNLTPEQVAERLDRLRRYVADAGRSMADLLLTVRPGLANPVTVDLAARYEALGVRLLVADVDYRRLTLPEALAQVAHLARALHLSGAGVA